MIDWPFGLLRKNSYALIAMDIPWRFKTYNVGGVPQRAPEQHYKTMTMNEIKALPVGELAANDCAVMAWVISSHVPQLFYLMQHWGFQYSSKAFCWAKMNKHAEKNMLEKPVPISADENWFMGLGYGSRRNTEDCYLFTRGAPKRLDMGVRELIIAPIGEHSRKPDEFLIRAERLYGGPRLEMFSRSNRAGWSVFGDETGKFDN